MFSDGDGIAVEQANLAVFPYGKTGARRVLDRKKYITKLTAASSHCCSRRI